MTTSSSTAPYGESGLPDIIATSEVRGLSGSKEEGTEQRVR